MLSEDKRSSIIDVTDGSKLDDIQRRKLQHEFKLYMEQYFKRKLGKGVDHTKIVIWEDMLIIRGKDFLPNRKNTSWQRLR